MPLRVRRRRSSSSVEVRRKRHLPISFAEKRRSCKVPISDFSHGKGSAAFSKVENDNPVVVLKHNKPAFVIVTPDEYRTAKEAEENLNLLMLAIERSAGMNIYSCAHLEDVMSEMGVTREELDAMDEVEFE